MLFCPGRVLLPNLPGVAINANGGCDIANIPGGILGSASITATARYPFEPVTAQPVVSNTVVKTVTSLFSKTITCYPKGNAARGAERGDLRRAGDDITGAPFVGETVCFFADFNAEDIQHFSGCDSGTSIGIGDEGRNEDAEESEVCAGSVRSRMRMAGQRSKSGSNRRTVDVQACSWTRGSSGT